MTQQVQSLLDKSIDLTKQMALQETTGRNSRSRQRWLHVQLRSGTANLPATEMTPAPMTNRNSSWVSISLGLSIMSTVWLKNVLLK